MMTAVAATYSCMFCDMSVGAGTHRHYDVYALAV